MKSPFLLDVVKVSLLLLILVTNCLFYYRSITGLKRPEYSRDAIGDALIMVGQKRLVLQDSITKLDQDYEVLTFKKDSVDRLDSANRADLRDSYRTRIKQRIRSGL